MATRRATVVFGLTGGIASGKSTVAARFRERGVPVIDADEVARAVVGVGTEGLESVVGAFGAELLRPDGSLDRPKLGALVFQDEAQRLRLESLVNPLIAAEAARRITQLERDGHALICYDAALLVERGLADSFRPLVVVSLPAATQRERLMRRDRLTEDEADQRLRTQLPLAERLKQADHVLDNRGTPEELAVAADRVLAAIAEGATAAHGVLLSERGEPAPVRDDPPR
ncbi:MAG: dephospho-CoA kinase [Myxococcales bacterium]|nr:dephospho-CoA kinase [Myxococcales bacterium]